MVVSQHVDMAGRPSVLQHRGAPILGLTLRHLQFLVLHQQIIDRFAQQDRFRDSRFRGQLIEQYRSVLLKVQGLHVLFACCQDH